MKKIIAFFALAASALSAHADAGPLYVSYGDYCNLKEIYINEYGEFYGAEIGCSSILGSPVFGTVDQLSGNAYASTMVSGRTCLHVYRGDFVLRGGCSDGYQYSYNDPIYYRVTSYRPRSAAKAAPGSKELPSIYD